MKKLSYEELLFMAFQLSYWKIMRFNCHSDLDYGLIGSPNASNCIADFSLTKFKIILFEEYEIYLANPNPERVKTKDPNALAIIEYSKQIDRYRSYLSSGNKVEFDKIVKLIILYEMYWKLHGVSFFFTVKGTDYLVKQFNRPGGRLDGFSARVSELEKITDLNKLLIVEPIIRMINKHKMVKHIADITDLRLLFEKLPEVKCNE